MYLNTPVDALEDLPSVQVAEKKEAYNLRNLNAFYFLIYAMIGWLFEVIYCFAVDGVFVNRGLLHGPYLPVYGFGAIIVINLIAPYTASRGSLFLASVLSFNTIAPRWKPVLSLFLASMFICTVLEYFTSWYMETVFNVSLWNYSEFFLNIDGRVCLWNTLLFGLLALLVIYVFQPFFNRHLHYIPSKWRPFLSVLLVSGLVVDFLFRAFTIQELASQASQVLVLFS